MTNEEAMRVLKTMRTDADVHANICGVTGGEKFIRKRDALDMAIESMESMEKFCDAIDQALEKFIPPERVPIFWGELAVIFFGGINEEVTTCERNERPSGS